MMPAHGMKASKASKNRKVLNGRKRVPKTNVFYDALLATRTLFGFHALASFQEYIFFPIGLR